MRLLSCILSAAVLAAPAFAQPAFEIADVHASPRSSQPRMSGGMMRGGRYELRKATMLDLIRTAYAIDPNNVIGGPSWLETDRFDVIARMPATTSPDTVNQMLRALLAERFKLVVHNDQKRLDGFVLSPGKGKHKLRESEGASPGDTGCRPQQVPPQPGQVQFANVTCRNMTMEVFATALRSLAGAYITSAVTDSTALKGAWDFDLRWTPRPLLPVAGADGISLFDAVERQLGLKLEPQKVSTPVIVVDSVNQKPSENPPGVAERLPPPPPAEFEVADIKPSAPGAQQGGGFQPGGRIDIRGMPLRVLIAVAWDLDPMQPIPGEPKWLNTEKFDVVAKATTTTTTATIGPNIDFDDLRMMLRGLLKDRFKLATHYEDRPVTAYTLTAPKPKLKKADPASRSGCKIGPAPATQASAEAGRPQILMQVTCQNMTMAQLTEQFPTFGQMYTRYPVVNATGLDGSWDFVVTFSPVPPSMMGAVRAAGRGGPDGPPAPPTPGVGGGITASDPTGALTLFEAVDKQLGLKLEAQKRPLPVLVIDHVEEKPTDN